jgi:hypothetical protein
MLFAIFEASVEPQEHDANQLTTTNYTVERYLVYTTNDWKTDTVEPTRVFMPTPTKNRWQTASVDKARLTHMGIVGVSCVVDLVSRVSRPRRFCDGIDLPLRDGERVC